MVLVAAFFVFEHTCCSANGAAVGCGSQSKSSLEEKYAGVVQFNSQYMETTYHITAGACQISWIVNKSDPDKSVVRHRSKCNLPLNEQVPLLSKILAEILNAGAFHTLFWGRLVPDKKDYLEMSFRLAIAAYESPLWDSKRGVPKKGHKNAFIVKIANKANIYNELKELFEEFNRKLEFTSAEKVLVLNADKLPFFDRLKKYGVNATDKLPFDCMTWFSVSRIEE